MVEIDKAIIMDKARELKLQIIHEDNNTYTIEDMRFKRTCTHGSIIARELTIEQVNQYIKEYFK